MQHPVGSVGQPWVSATCLPDHSTQCLSLGLTHHLPNGPRRQRGLTRSLPCPPRFPRRALYDETGSLQDCEELAEGFGGGSGGGAFAELYKWVGRCAYVFFSKCVCECVCARMYACMCMQTQG